MVKQDLDQLAINTIRKIQSPLEPLVMEMAELD